MKREDLEKLGLTGETLEKAELPGDLIDKIMALHGKDIETHKSKIETAGSELETVKKQLTEANDQIEKFKGLKPDELQKAADDYKAKYEQAQKDAADQIASLKFDHALDGALAEAKAKNPKAVKALLKADDLKLAEDGSIVGLSEQLEKVKSENDYLFASEETTPRIVKGANNQTVVGKADVARAAMLKAAGLPPDE